ncbi:hypothetical protein [Lichenibacterium dinghuense]|uniref:hypothetical protein n=1 Tax=Lichenibacterium dinghuense TaxID=2895977 RepID=UPI001F33BDD2|nr:hypothetical protein [Lichenibacterium sp. 6Y81]
MSSTSGHPPFDPTKQPPYSPSDKQICLYVAEMCVGLRQLATRHRLRTITYLLDMARLESERTAKELPD